MRKATAFRGGANKTAPPCETLVVNKYLATVPVEQLQRNITLQKILAPRKNNFQRPAKGDSTPAFACQRAAIAPLPARIYNLDSYHSTLFEFDSFKICNCSRKTSLQNPICSANVGYSPTPRQHF